MEAVRKATDNTAPAELILGCQRHERVAQAAFYQAYKEEVLRTLYRVLGPDTELEDVLQDVFVEAFRSIDRFRGDAKITTWLYRVAVNVALQRLRKRSRRPQTQPAAEADLLHEQTPLRSLQQKEARRQVYEVLDTIAPKKRTVFVLHELMGLNAKEIAEIVETNVLTVRTRLHYARKEFYRKALEAESLREQRR